MGKKLFIASVIIVTILFGVIFWKVSDTEQIEQHDMKTAYPIVKDAAPVEQTSTSASESKEMAKMHSKEVNRSVEKQEQIVEQIAPPAFGFLPRGDSLQVVGLLSEHDRGGLLMEYIDQLCQSRSCAVDVDYQADIIDAKWQKDIVEILKLFQSGSIENGSFFIEANRIKLEGKVKDEKSAFSLQHYFSSLKEEGMGVENHIAMDSFIENEKVESVERGKAAEKNASVSTQKSVEKKEKTSDAADQLRSVAKELLKTSKTDEKLSAVTKEEERSLPVSHAQAARKKVVSALDESNNSKTVQKREVKKSVSKVIKKSVTKKVRVKKVRTSPKKPVRDIIAPSHMETSVDIGRKISKNCMHTERSSKQSDDIVAESKLEILN